MPTAKRRPPGQVRDAIAEALREKPSGASVSEIHLAVEGILGDDVAPSSVRSYLQLGTQATPPAFKRTGHGRYQLAKK